MEDVSYFIILILTSVLLFLTSKYSYWRRKNVAGPLPLPILGDYSDYFTMKKTLGITVKEIYDKYPEKGFIGSYLGTEPVLIPKDLEMIRTILTKDFHMFNGRVLSDHEFRDPAISASLFFTSGDNWKMLRKNLNPMFTTGKLKNFFPLVMQCGERFETYLQDIYKQNEIQDFRQISTNFILECIGSTLFGMHFEAMVVEDNVIKNMASQIENIKTDAFIKNTIREMWPSFYHVFTSKMPLFGDIAEKFAILAHQSFQSRNFKPSGRKDLVDLLLNFKEQGFLKGDGMKNSIDTKTIKIEVSDSLLIAQVLVFFGAGFTTSSMAISLTLFELAKNEDIQKKLIAEIDKTLEKCDRKITYEIIQNMKYLDMVVSETLRKYPVLGVITRECMGDYNFIDYDLKIEKGTRIHIPVWAIHHDPKYYPDPLKFDPDRFSQEHIQQRHPYSYLAFGEGQRICIGMRFSKIQVAIGLMKILDKYTLEDSAMTPDVVEFDPRAIATTPLTPIHLKMVPRNSTVS